MGMEKSMKGLIEEIKEELFSNSTDLYSFASISAYETAWLAMIPIPENPGLPMFPKCLDWIINNQNELGFWGEPDHLNKPTLECLSSTLICMVALKTWNVGFNNMIQGLDFLHENVGKLLLQQNGRIPQWFTIIFPTLIELAHDKGLELFPQGSMKFLRFLANPAPLERARRELSNGIYCRYLSKNIWEETFVHEINKEEAYYSQAFHPSLLNHIIALHATSKADWENILEQQNEDGSLFQSPSTTALVFMATKNKNCRAYLESVMEKCGNGVPQIYPIDEELIKLYIVDRLERLGLEEHFEKEIEDVLVEVHRNWRRQGSRTMKKYLSNLQTYKDSLAFRLLRTHGYHVSPSRFCWFLDRKEILSHIEENYDDYLSTMLNIYQASNLMFLRENELEIARSFSKRILEKGRSRVNQNYNPIIPLNLQSEIEQELRNPWFARLDHLEHRKFIEICEANDICSGAVSNYRLFCINNSKLLQLANQNFIARQSIFRRELKELQRWAKESGIHDIGFGRERTTYCYFAIASTAYDPCLSDLRISSTKSAALVTILDDFFDMKGSMEELNSFVAAVKRWDGEGLHGHGKILLEALASLVRDTAQKVHTLHGKDVTKNLQEIWHQTIISWLKEAEWSRSGYAPSIDMYLEVGKTSTAVETIIFHALFFLAPDLSTNMKHHSSYNAISNFLKTSCRLLNDMQSHEKEKEQGKSNFVHLYLRENSEASIEDAINYIRKMVDQKKKELLEHVLMNEMNCMPKPCKEVHLSSLKVFQLFYNSSNAFDSSTEVLESIDKAIYKPIKMQKLRPHRYKQCSYGEECGNSMFIVQSKQKAFGRSISNHTWKTLLPKTFVVVSINFGGSLPSIQREFYDKNNYWKDGLSKIISAMAKTKTISPWNGIKMFIPTH